MQIDADDVLARIEHGESQAEIARTLGTYPMQISRLLDSTPELELRSARARAISAEAWLDRGLDYVLDSNNDANRAKIVVQECARRAALRNPAYREKTAHEHTGKDGASIMLTISAKDADI